jgi:thioredoxin 1
MKKQILIFFACAALFVAAGCGGEKADESTPETASRDTAATYATPGMSRAGVEDQRAGLPRMVDLGRGECIPCKMMAPILEELTEEYRGRAIIEVIDISDKPEAVKLYGMRVMPTQVFFDAEGSEVWRHEGFLPKEAIVEKLSEMGVHPPNG